MTTERRFRRLPSRAVLAALMLVPASALAAPKPFGVFVYSSLCIEAESGDFSGYRVTVDWRPDGFSGLLDYGNGPLAKAPLDHIALDRESGDLTFDATTADGPVAFHGGMSPRFVSGELTFNGREREVSLSRVMHTGQRYPRCR
jgi:hypothetical protein